MVHTGRVITFGGTMDNKHLFYHREHSWACGWQKTRNICEMRRRAMQDGKDCDRVRPPLFFHTNIAQNLSMAPSDTAQPQHAVTDDKKDHLCKNACVLQVGQPSIYPRNLAKAGKLGLKPRATTRIWMIPLWLLITLLDTWLTESRFLSSAVPAFN